MILPPTVLGGLRKAREARSLGKFVWADFRRFARHYSRNPQTVEGRSLEVRALQAHLIVHAHAVEKGLSHANIRYRFGASSVGSLAWVMELYSTQGHPKDAEPYLMALSVLGAYWILHEGQKIYDTPLSEAPEWLLNEIRASTSYVGGIVQVIRTEVGPSTVDGFNAVAFGRHSVREYNSSSVSAEKIREAIRVASRAPSVCNRQSIRVRVVRSPNLIRRLLKIQGGFGGYSLPPVLLAITADARDYVDATERNQPYIDGGLFSMGLLLGLESVNLAACALNTMFSVDQERRLRTDLELDDPELPIMLVAVGGFPRSYAVPKSFRYDPDHLTL